MISEFFSIDNFELAAKWTRRGLAGGIGGYYSLGLAYKYGVKQRVDDVCLKIILHSVGVAGAGALMPQVQYYTAYAIRISAAFVTAMLYDITEKVALMAWKRCFPPKMELLPTTRPESPKKELYSSHHQDGDAIKV